VLRNPSIVLVLFFAPALSWAQFNITISPQTAAGFDQYRKTAEGQFSWMPRYAQIQPGEVKIEPAKSSGPSDVAAGLVHDWTAAIVVRNASPAQVLRVLQNYAAYKTIYAPDIVESRIISHDGERYRVGLKLKKSKAITVILNAEFDVEYRELAPGRWSMTSRSSRLAEMDGDRELPVGTGLGVLWRMNAYWLIEQRPEGVYLECRTISLSRDVPFLLGPVVRPFISGIPRESLQKTMDATVRAVRAENPLVAE